MMRRNLLVVALLILTAFGASTAWAELTPEKVKAAEVLIKQLSVDEFMVRQQALEKLVELGPEVMDLLKKAMAENDDPELELRGKMTLSRIREKYSVDEDGKPIKIPSFEPSRVTINFKGIRLDTLMKLFAEQTGNEEIKVANDIKNNKIDFEVKDMPYWDALDAVCRQAEVIYDYDWRSKKPQLYKAGQIMDIGVNVGPAAIKIIQANKSRSFRVRGGMRGSLSYTYCFFLENWLPVVRARAIITRAVDQNGTELGKRNRTRVSTRWFSGGGYMNRQQSFHISNLPVDLTEIAEMEGVVQLELGIGEEKAVIKDVFNTKKDKKWLRTEELTLTVTDASQQDDGFQLKVVGTGPRSVTNTSGTSSGYGLFLVDPSGKRFSGRLRSSSFRGINNNQVKFEMTLRYKAPEAKGAWSVLWIYPEKTISKDIPFKLHNVPLP